jgi:hypothetical protein
VSQISDAVNALQSAAGPQVEEAAKKAAEEAATAEAAE